MDEFDIDVEQKKRGVSKFIIVICFVVFFVVIGGAMYFGFEMMSQSDYLTYENYSKIRNGMSYGEVVEIFEGHHGTLQTSGGYGDYRLEYYAWTNSFGTKVVVVGFENNKVMTKSQTGLS